MLVIAYQITQCHNPDDHNIELFHDRTHGVSVTADSWCHRCLPVLCLEINIFALFRVRFIYAFKQVVNSTVRAYLPLIRQKNKLTCDKKYHIFFGSQPSFHWWVRLSVL